jgi:hypothetical protein
VSAPFDEFGPLAADQVAAVVEAEILIDPVRARTYGDVLRRCVVMPRPIQCEIGAAQPTSGDAAQRNLWLVLEEPPAWDDHQFIAFEPRHRSFALGHCNGAGSWYLDRWGGFFSLLELLATGRR